MTGTDFADFLSYAMDESNGTIPYAIACRAAALHGVVGDFISDYGVQGNNPLPVDAGEFLSWLGY